MVIDPNNSVNAVNTSIARHKKTTSSSTGVEGVKTQEKQAPRGGQESVFLSSKAQSLHQLEAKIQSSPDSRAERVESIRKAINDGSFSVNPEQLAERLLEQDSLFQ